MNTDAFLSGYKVLDLSQYIPGPFATLQLANLGADVIKVEPPHGDPMQFPMMPDTSEQSPLYLHLNRGKRIVRMDLKSQEGKTQLERLLQQADVLMESFRPGVMAKLGFSQNRLRQINPRLVHCALSGFGQTGPYRDQAGHDLTYCAASGALALSGTQERPVMSFPPVADHAGALQAANAIQAALLGRAKTGQGAFLDISLYESALSWQYLTLNPTPTSGPKKRETDMLTGGLACYNIYQTKDHRFIALAPLETKFWASFCQAVGRQEWVDRQFEMPQPQEQLINELRALFATKNAQAWQIQLDGADCCFEIIPTVDEIRAHPQTRARSILNEWEPAYPAWINGMPCKLNSKPEQVTATAPLHWKE